MLMRIVFLLVLATILPWDKSYAESPQHTIPMEARPEVAASSRSLEMGNWSIPLGAGDATPVVIDGHVFVSDATFDDDGVEALRIQCLEALTGQTIWSRQLVEKSFALQDVSDRFPVRPITPLTSTEHGIVSISYGGCVSCFDPKNGCLRWTLDLVDELHAPPLQFGWCSQPWTDGEIIILACGGPEALLVAIDVNRGNIIWKAGQGEAAYGSIVSLPIEGELQLAYMGQNELIGVDPIKGKVLWNYPLPKPGLTNTVTPLSLAHSRLLVSGQGLNETRMLQVSRDGSGWKVAELWQSSRMIPFYCNWMIDEKSQSVIGFASGRTVCLNLENGDSNWKQRGWTDANFIAVGAKVLGIRGDGWIGLCEITNEGLQLTHGTRAVSDRIWAPPVIVGTSVLIRGRQSLTALDLHRLPKLSAFPQGTDVDAMSAMYGQRHEKVAALLETAQNSPKNFDPQALEELLADRSIRFAPRDYQDLFIALQDQPATMRLPLARDWVSREPLSIVAFDNLTTILEHAGFTEEARQNRQERSVEIDFVIDVPNIPSPPTMIYLTGNAAATGNWKSKGVPLQRMDDGRYSGRIALPRGDFEFKLTLGSVDLEEARSDGRGISNRRRRIQQPITIQASVQGWKTPNKRENSPTLVPAP